MTRRFGCDTAGFLCLIFGFSAKPSMPVPTGAGHERPAQSVMDFFHVIPGHAAVYTLVHVDVSDKLDKFKLIVIQSVADHHHVFPSFRKAFTRERVVFKDVTVKLDTRDFKVPF